MMATLQDEYVSSSENSFNAVDANEVHCQVKLSVPQWVQVGLKMHIVGKKSSNNCVQQSIGFVCRQFKVCFLLVSLPPNNLKLKRGTLCILHHPNVTERQLCLARLYLWRATTNALHAYLIASVPLPTYHSSDAQSDNCALRVVTCGEQRRMRRAPT